MSCLRDVVAFNLRNEISRIILTTDVSNTQQLIDSIQLPKTDKSAKNAVDLTKKSLHENYLEINGCMFKKPVK